jgi:hypothetical protein
MSLVQVATNTVTSAVAQVDLVGITTDDVYMVTISGVKLASDQDLNCRVLKSSSPDTTYNYDGASKILRTDSTFSNSGYANNDSWFIDFLGNGVDEMGNCILYLHNFNASSEYSFATQEGVAIDDATPTLKGRTGGIVHTVASASNGIRFFGLSSVNISAGTFTLYKVI